MAKKESQEDKEPKPKKNKKGKKLEEEKEVALVVVEEELVITESSWTEDIVMAGEGIFGFIQQIVRESTVRRITVRNSNGRILFDIPLAVGLVAVYPPVFMYSLLALGFAVMSEYTVSIERIGSPEEESSTEG